MKKTTIEDETGEEKLVTTDDTHIVFCSPKHYVPSHGTTWANEIIRCSYLCPQKFDVTGNTDYSIAFMSTCRIISDSLLYFLDTTEQKDIERVKADNTFVNYELQRVVHLERCLDYSLISFSTKLSRDDETKLFACNIIPCLKSI